MRVLPPPRLIELAGPDAAAFAQAQFCNDVDALGIGGTQLNAWLDPQGRIRAFFHLLRPTADRFVLCLRGGDAAALVRPLRMFVLRLKTKVEALEGWRHVLAKPGEALPAAALRLGPFEALLPPDIGAEAEAADEETLTRLARSDIEAGLPWFPPHALDALLPSWLDFARLGAISQKKGCYPGQEIVARLHFRGGGDKRVPVVVRGETQVVQSATLLRDIDGAEAGLVLQSAVDGSGHRIALAVVRKERCAPGTLLAAVDGSIQVISSELNRPT